jgi:hypothetical protein
VREQKVMDPDAFCPHPKCLWRRVNGRTGEVKECPKHGPKTGS